MARAHKGPHKYKRVLVKDQHVYRCMLPGCSHYTQEAFIVGQEARCFKCDRSFIVGGDCMFPRKKVKLHCRDCNRPTFNKSLGKVAKGSATQTKVPLSDANIMSLVFGEKKDED